MTPYKRLECPLFRPCNYTTLTTKQHAGLCRGVSCDCTCLTAHDTRQTQADIMPPVPRWRAYQRPDALHRYQIPPPRRTLYRSAQAAYYNNVYIRGQTMQARRGQLLPCADRWQVLHPAHLLRGQPGGVSMLSTPGGWRSGRGSAVRAGGLAHSTRRDSPAAGAAGRRGTICGSRRISFRAIAR